MTLAKRQSRTGIAPLPLFSGGKVLSCWLVCLLSLCFSLLAEAAVINQVQSGTATSTSNGTVSVSITAVDPSKAFLVFQTRSSSNRPPGAMVRGRINAAGDAVEFVRVSSITSTINIQWYVVEYSSGVSVQRGEVTQSSTSTNVAITPVASTSQAFVLWSKTSASGDSQNLSEDDPITGQLTSTSNLRFRAGNANSSHIIAWQVVEYTDSADINVQTGSTSLTGSSSTVDVSLGTAVNTANSFLLTGYRTSSSGSDIGERMIRAQLIDATTLRFDRDRTGDSINEIIWQVVELKDGTTVQHGSERLNNGDAQNSFSITAVDTSRAIAFASVQAIAGQSLGKSFYNSDDIPGVASATLALSSASVNIQRNHTGHRADIGWFVVEFPAPSEHFAISHDGAADTCNAESIIISKHDASHTVDTTYTGTITLSTSTGNGDWSLLSGAGALVNAGGGNATYTYAASDAGQVTLGLSNSISETLNINVTDGSASELGSEDADLTFTGAVSETYSDTFSSTSYSRNDGTLNWAGSWSEIGDGGGASGGDVQVDTDMGSGRLHIQDRNNGIWREVDLSSYSGATATLSFDYRRDSLDNSNEYVTVSIYNGSTWVANLDSFAGPATDSSYQAVSYDISSYMFANTRIRFYSSNAMRNWDDFYIDNVEIAVASSAVCPGVDHFVMSHDALAINCLAEPVGVTAVKSDGSTDTTYTGTITLDTQTGTGSWSLSSGNGIFTDATAGDGVATYSFDAADNGVASFNLDYQSGPASVDVDAYEGTTRDDDTEGNLVFSPNGFVVTATALSNPPPASISTLIPAQTAATGFNLYLAAYGQTPTDPTCGIIESYDGAKNLAFWFSYDDPSSGTRSLTVNGSNAASSEGAASTQSITFNSGQAAIALNYTDVGQLTLSMKDDTVTADLPTGIRGSSDAFVVKPAGFVLSSIQRSSDGFTNPAAADANGTAFVQAGEAFSVTVTAVNSAGNPTPNYGQESTAEGVLLTPAIVSAGGVNNPAIGFATGFSGFSNGVATGTDFYWDEVGIISLIPSVADADYLGVGNITGTTTGNVGRFYPSYFTTAVSGGSLDNVCATATPFTYIGESFGYDVNPTITVTAKSAIGSTVQNYSGTYAKLTSAGLSLTYPLADNSQLDQDGVNPIGVSVSVGGMGRTDNADGSLTFMLGGSSTDVFAYDRALGLVDPFAADLGIQLTAASDGEANASDLGTPKVISPSGNLQRFGRATALDATTPYTTLGLTQTIPVTLQYYSAGAWVDNTDDGCTTFTYTQVDDGITTTVTPASPATVIAGAGDLTVQLDADSGDAGGRTTITFGWDDWLLYDLDGVDQLSDGNLYDDSFSTSVTFGAFRGDDRFLYWRE